MNRRSFHRTAAGLAFGAALLAPITAYTAWPDKPIQLVVPYAPGGTADALARIIAQHLGPKPGTTAVVVNRPGASGVIGSSSVAQAAPDGYAVLYDATPLSINPHPQKMPFDPEKDLLPVSLVGVTPMLAVVHRSSPYQTIHDLVKAAKAAPGKITFGSGGQGTVQYMGAELFAQGAGAKMLHVPYKSGTPAITAAIAGEVDFGFANLPALAPHIKSGSLRPLAITSATRNAAYPDVPTVSEAAVRGFEAYEWNGLFLPGGTPADIVARLSTALREVLAMPDVRARIEALGPRIVGSTPEEFRTFLATERTRWANTVQAAGIKKE